VNKTNGKKNLIMSIMHVKWLDMSGLFPSSPSPIIHYDIIHHKFDGMMIFTKIKGEKK